ncbi:rho guanine nucleotide exchange factor 17 isoform X1 [Falco biarmicus]|uniref:rho guanine nucleotide exchange factor 17 isoform X1 n=1 Tax=Falco biarmicus TaxID=345155 RepID=UPI0024BC76A2|nr:rho guanine nucleotide exchange factor 17 isoform X1 [Falco biarmicus]
MAEGGSGRGVAAGRWLLPASSPPSSSSSSSSSFFPGRKVSASIAEQQPGRAFGSLAPSVRQLSLRFTEPEPAGPVHAGAQPPSPAPPPPPPPPSSPPGPGLNAEPPRWPSVPAMRKLFGESCRQPPGGAGSGNGSGSGMGSGSGGGSGRGAPPPPPPRSRVPHPALRSPRGAPPEPGPHSWHNSPRPQPPSSSPSPRANGEAGAAAPRSPRASPGGGGDGQGGGRHRAARREPQSGGRESPAGGGGAAAEGGGRGVPRHPLPLVARVSKVNIPPFGSPGGSRSSSRYSSTETLKEEEQFGVCWPGQGRTLQAGYGVCRSPSFGTSDGLAWGQPAVRVRPKLLQGMAKTKPDFGSESLHQPGLEGERDKHRKSLSNPDIANETLTLLSFLKSDLSELKVKKKGVRIGLDMGSDSCSGITDPSPGGRGATQPPSRWAPGERPTLKDLTATLRRTKSFTGSEKSGSRRLFLQSTMKQSSSELLLATADSQDRGTLDGGQRGYEDAPPMVIQDQYIQEARQVFEKISRMGSQQDYGFTAEEKDSGGVEGAEVVAPMGTMDVTLRGRAESTRCLKEAESKENLARRKSVEELSGHESSVTDEGIVTEPEPVGMPFQDLHEAVDAWTLPSAGPAAGDTETPLPTHPAAAVEDLPAGKSETPSTPGSLRRRRKFPLASANGMEGGSEGGTEPYRSLSDPMPHRRCSVTEEVKNFSVDSNLLGSLSTKVGIPQPAAIAGSAGSAGSDLSLGSDGPRDYSSLIQTIVSQPGAMAKLIDEKGNGKTIKKKSLSDPSRRGELPAGAFEGPGEAISELEPSIPPSSSEPILSAQPAVPGTGRSYGFDPKLADVLSPRITRRSSKKRSNRAAHQENQPPPVPAVLAKSRPATKHVRHTSEPATFIPITVPEPLVPSGHQSHLPTPAASRSPSKSSPTLQPPSLEDVTKRYMLALNSGEASPSPGDGPRSPPAAPPPRLPRCPRPPDEHSPRTKPQVDMRKHVIMTLLDTEQSYVESLRTLMQGYMKPLKQPENSLLCDPSLVDEIFDQIPELLEHHEQFLEQIHDCVQNWHEKQKVGDLLVQSFSKDVLVNIYSAYIDNFLNAKDAVRIAKEARPAFMKFLEQSMRENKEKQALSDLMIKPVQRIPRYELLVKDLLKHTPEDHPDHPFLIDAQRNIKQVAERINKGMKSAEEVERNARIVQEIESHIEGMEDLQAPLRRFLRQEMVVEVKAVGGKKDRSFFLFTDLLVCTTLKRKSGSLRRSSMSLYTAASVIDTASKYKLLWKLPLEDVDIVKGASQATNRESIQKSICRLDEDLSTLGQVSKLSETLSFPHQSLDDVIKDLMAAIHRELAEKQSMSFSMAFPPNKVELSTTKADGTESFIFEFPNPDARLGFEQAFEDAKKKLGNTRDQGASSKNCLDPEFLKAIPIMKTRSGMQFSCASPSHGSPESSHEVWVCNSDGYVGQVCLLSIRKEPTVEACIAVCSARILCIASVPGLKRVYRERAEPVGSPSSELMPVQPEDAGPQPCLHISISGSSLELSEPVDGGNRELVPFDSDDTDDESSPSPSGTLQSQASHSTISSSFGNEEIPSCKEATAETTSSEEEQEPSFLPISGTYGQNRHGESPTDGRALRRSSRGSFTRGSLEDLLSLDPEAHQSSMWLGTEDGCIHVYQSSDNIRNRKNSMKMQHAAAVMCILYLDNQVFVSLANGELVAYQREAGHFWDPQNSKSLSLGSPGSPITKMVAVAGKLWCGCQNRIIILNTTTLAQEHTLQVGQDSGRSVTCMVSAGTGVWVALQSSAQVRLYHATSYEQLTEADITPPVHKMLAGSDAIIRQHKAACLRITALLACKDLLWIGTSAGVVLTLTVSAKAAPALVGLSQGHTGHVRFLTAIELPDGFEVLFPLPRETGAEKPSEAEKRDPSRPRALALSKPKMLVISGGDGYEDFRLTSSSETVGRDDSTNHLLLWRV